MFLAIASIALLWSSDLKRCPYRSILTRKLLWPSEDLYRLGLSLTSLWRFFLAENRGRMHAARALVLLDRASELHRNSSYEKRSIRFWPMPSPPQAQDTGLVGVSSNSDIRLPE